MIFRSTAYGDCKILDHTYCEKTKELSIMYLISYQDRSVTARYRNIPIDAYQVMIVSGEFNSYMLWLHEDGDI